MSHALDETIEQLLGEPPRGYSLNAMYLCPFHDEDTPSFSINRENGRYQCFGCSAKGGIEKLARLVGVQLDETARQDILIRGLSTQPVERRDFSPIARKFAEQGRSGRGLARIGDYLGARGLPSAVADHFGLGYDESRSCITLPYWDGDTCTGIKLRAGDGFKYSQDNSTYGLYSVDDVRGKPSVAIGEGESDTHQLWARMVFDRGGEDVYNDFPQCAVGGTSGAVKSERLWQLFALDLMFANTVYICYDADEAGDEAFEYARRALGVKAVRIRPPKEGDDITKHFQNGGTLAELGLA